MIIIIIKLYSIIYYFHITIFHEINLNNQLVSQNSPFYLK